MKVTFEGFALTPNEGLSLVDFFKELVKSHEGDFEIAKKKRIFLFDNDFNDKFCTGGLITLKENKKFMQLKKEGKSIEIIVKEISKDNDLIDINFFIINKKTFRGLYQYYYGSTSLRRFGYFLRDRYRDISDIYKENEIKNLLDDRSKKKQEKLIKKKYSQSLALTYLLRRKAFNDLVQSMSQVKNFEFEFMTLGSGEDEFTPLTENATKIRHIVSFGKNSPVTLIKNAIKKLVINKGLIEGKIVGINNEGLEKAYSIANSAEIYYENELDKLLSSPGNIANLSDNNIIAKLVEVAGNNAYMFETPNK